MPWLGQADNMIDRFDVRAHLDQIPDVPALVETKLSKEEGLEERQANYERYRILVQNEFLGSKSNICFIFRPYKGLKFSFLSHK